MGLMPYSPDCPAELPWAGLPMTQPHVSAPEPPPVSPTLQECTCAHLGKPRVAQHKPWGLRSFTPDSPFTLAPVLFQGRHVRPRAQHCPLAVPELTPQPSAMGSALHQPVSS